MSTLDPIPSRLRTLLSVSRAVVEELDHTVVLERVLESARTVVGARFAAIGVIAPDGRLERFLDTGIPEGVVESVRAPLGEGIPGLRLGDPEPVRLRGLSIGPLDEVTGRPLIRSILSVPIRVRGEIFGSLFAAEHPRGGFTADDQELLTALSAAAGVAIENSRLFEETAQRQRWSSALAELTAALLADEGDALTLLLDRAAELTDADVATLIRPVAGDRLLLERARGPRAAEFEGRIVPLSGSVTERVLASGQPVLVDSYAGVDEMPSTLGPSIVVPMQVGGATPVLLGVGRRTAFKPFDLELVGDFAAQAAVAVRLAQAREEKQRYDLLEERSRIARELHDSVIQRLFASGLTLQRIGGAIPDDATRAVLDAQVASLDEAIAEVRTAIFALTVEQGERLRPLRLRLIDLVGELAALFPSVPRLSFSGAVDLAVVPELGDDVVAVTREALMNVSRHAQATTTDVNVAVRDGRLTVQVADDGIGIGDIERSSGSLNMRARAEHWGGRLEYRRRAEGGTLLMWEVALPGEAS
ncbi:sensor histidine kinase [Herbiconiux sp. SYSU D00978]|uniref:sensor histidine kinase n=1 Tax=Herbiconiux sp. SYSU D00978 TaxID=2812562 RepID=UPI001A974237|nr:GAF domain-containing protein [Herbiconiux sp. SYSU D00978]